MARLVIRLTPRASRDELSGMRDGVLHARVTAAPVDGAANEALTRLLARSLRVPKSAVTIVSGETSRTKRVDIEGLDDLDVQKRLRVEER